MSLRCKPGDLAVVTYASHDHPNLIGKIVDVIAVAPMHRFVLPDGYSHHGCDASYWIVRFQHPVAVPVGSPGSVSGARDARYATVPDFALRPIRPDADPIDVERDEPEEIAA